MAQQELITVDAFELDGRSVGFEQATFYVERDPEQPARWHAELFHWSPRDVAGPGGEGCVLARTAEGIWLRGRVSLKDTVTGAGSLLLRGVGPLDEGSGEPAELRCAAPCD